MHRRRASSAQPNRERGYEKLLIRRGGSIREVRLTAALEFDDFETKIEAGGRPIPVRKWRPSDIGRHIRFQPGPFRLPRRAGSGTSQGPPRPLAAGSTANPGSPRGRRNAARGLPFASSSTPLAPVRLSSVRPAIARIVPTSACSSDPTPAQLTRLALKIVASDAAASGKRRAHARRSSSIPDLYTAMMRACARPMRGMTVGSVVATTTAFEPVFSP